MTEDQKYPSELAERFQVRMPDGLRDRIKAAADANNRSMNAEILATLEREYPAPSDVMYVHLDNIRHALDLYEKATDPGARLQLQTLVETMATSGHNFEIEWDDEDFVGPAALDKSDPNPPPAVDLKRRLEGCDADIASREAAGENIKPLPRKPKIVPATKRKLTFRKKPNE